MKNSVKIGDFVKLTGTTVKTVNYYHKIGLLPVTERSVGGYRLYGPAELNRMRLIKRLKSLGLDLRNIKVIMGDLQSPKTWKEVLQSLRGELQTQKVILEEQLARIEIVLDDNKSYLNEDRLDSPSFQMITETLGTDQIEKYALSCPEMFGQHRKLYGILDDFQWGEEYQESFRALAEYFKAHPEQYQAALDAGVRWGKLSHLSEDDSQIEAMARESVALINSMPPVKELLCKYPEVKMPMESLYQELVAEVLSPAQLKYRQLFKQFLLED